MGGIGKRGAGSGKIEKRGKEGGLGKIGGNVEELKEYYCMSVSPCH